MSALCLAWLLSAASAGVSPTAPKTAHAGAPVLLALDLVVNGTPLGVTVPVREEASRISVRAGDLRTARLVVDASLDEAAWVTLTTRAGITARIDVPGQRLEISATDGARTPFRADLGPARDRPAASVSAVSALLLNYDLYGATPTTRSRGYVSGDLEARLMTPAGAGVTTALVDGVAGGRKGGHVVRLDSYWRTIDPVAVRSYTVGDVVSGALEWSNAYRLAGIQVQSAFEQRSDLITAALPSFSGSTALPSSVDLYVNNLKVYSGAVPGGPYVLSSLPDLTGGDVRIVTADATGRESVVTTRYFYSPRVLRRGLLEYSLDAGFPRRRYGGSSFAYDAQPVATASGRYGATGRLTIEASAELAPGLVEGGVGLVQGVGGIGVVSATVSGSRFDARAGVRAGVEWGMRAGDLSLFAAMQRASDDFTDVARLSQLRERRRGRHDPLLFDGVAYARGFDRAGLSFPMPFDRTWLTTLGYSAVRQEAVWIRSATASITRPVGRRATLYANAYRSFDRSRAYAATISLNLRLGGRTSVAAGVGSSSAGRTLDLTASGSTSQQQGEVGWSVVDREREDGPAYRRGQVTYRAEWAYVGAGLQQRGHEVQLTGQASGAVLLIGGEVRAVNHVGSSFALVRNAGPGTGINQETVAIARADRAGTAFLPDLLPYRSTAISIDPATLPADWSVPRTEQRATPAFQNGSVIDFGAHRFRAALAAIVDSAGAPLPPGSVAYRPDGRTAPVGYGGEVYLEEVGPVEELRIERSGDAPCHVTVRLPANRSGQVKIAPLVCR